MLTSLITYINLLAGSNGIEAAANKLLLWIDKGVYWAVSKIFAIFISMCQINLTVLVDMMGDLISRIKALIIVFVVFKLALALITNLNSPDKATEDAKKTLVNVLIAAALLVSYNLIFDVLNETSMLILGKPENYKYTRLSKIAGLTDEADEGMIMRTFFGTSGNIAAKDSEGIGLTLASKSLCATFPDTGKAVCKQLENVIGTGENTKINKLSNIYPYMGKEVDGHPFVALGLGLYMIYAIGKAAIEIGVRMFKLVILQLVAPIAIVSIIGTEGTKAKPFANFKKAYIQVFISAFTRIAAIFLVTIFVSKFFNNWETIFGSINSGGVTGLVTMVITVIAGYQFAGELPKFIDQIFGTSLGGDLGGKGFGNFLTSLATAPIAAGGAIVGGIAGSTMAAKEGAGWGAAALNGLAGAGTGFAAAFRGNSIAEKIRDTNQSNFAGNRARAVKMAEMGGAGAYLGGAALNHTPIFGKNGQDAKVARMDREIAGYDKDINKITESGKSYDELNGIIDAYDKAQVDGIKDAAAGSAAGGTGLSGFAGYGSAGIKYGNDKSSYAQSLLKYNTEYRNKSAALEVARRSGNATAISNAELALEKARSSAIKAAETDWENAKNAVNNDETKYQQELFKEKSSKLEIGGEKQELTLGTSTDADAHTYSIKDAKTMLGGEKTRLTREINEINKSKSKVVEEKEEYTHSAAYKNAHAYSNNNNK